MKFMQASKKSATVVKTTKPAEKPDPKATREKANKAAKESPLRNVPADKAKKDKEMIDAMAEQDKKARINKELRRRGIKVPVEEQESNIDTKAIQVEVDKASMELIKVSDPNGYLANALHAFISGGAAVISAVNAIAENKAQLAEQQAEKEEFDAEVEAAAEKAKADKDNKAKKKDK